MKTLLTAVMLLAVVCPAALAENNPIAGLDPSLYASPGGWQWGAFEGTQGMADESTIAISNESFVLHIQPAAPDGDYPGKMNGAIGTGYGSDRNGNLDFDHELYQVEVLLKVLEDNEASRFRIAISDSDGPGVRDEFYYYVDTFDYEWGEWGTFVRPLIDYNEVYSEGGDGEMNFGLNSLGLAAVWDSTESLDVEIGGIYITEIEPTPNDVIFELNANNFGDAWVWGSLHYQDHPDAVVYTENSIVIDAEDPGDDAGSQGAFGHPLLQRNFDGETTELVVKVRLLPDNQATSFYVDLNDDDEELLGTISAAGKTVERAAERYTYEFFTEELSEDEFIELRTPLTDYQSRGMGDGATLDGDEELNFGLYYIWIGSPWGSDRLNIEIDSIRIEPVGAAVPGDYNRNGALDAGDLDMQAEVIAAETNDPKYDLNNDDVVDYADREMWVNDLKNTWIGDSNLNGEFNSSDMVQVFSRGKYEKPETAGWEDGDWNGDTVFGSSDMVAAFVAGGYEKGLKPGGPNPAVSAVPEPSVVVLLLTALIALVTRRRRAA